MLHYVYFMLSLHFRNLLTEYNFPLSVVRSSQDIPPKDLLPFTEGFLNDLNSDFYERWLRTVRNWGLIIALLGQWLYRKCSATSDCPDNCNIQHSSLVSGDEQNNDGNCIECRDLLLLYWFNRHLGYRDQVSYKTNWYALLNLNRISIKLGHGCG